MMAPLARAAAAVAVVAYGALGAQPGPGTTPIGALRRADITAGSPSSRTASLLDLLSERREGILSDLTAARWDSVVSAARREAGFDADTASELVKWDRPLVRLWMNSGRSRQDRDGAVWQGRGLTAAASGGMVARSTWWEMALRPVVFVAQNSAFTPDPASATPNDYRDPAWGGFVDLPYRMGSGTYAAWDPGESYLQAKVGQLAAGVSTASEHWGPADRYPLLLGTEAGGFPRVFLNGRDLRVGIGRLHGRWVFGTLEASSQSGLAGGQRSRVASALAMSFTPKGLTGFEIGGGRFFHVRRGGGAIPWSSALWPFSGLVKLGTFSDPTGNANQLASLFARIAPDGAAVELYGEYLREDHNVNVRDLFAEPDHIAAYTFGLRRGWRAGEDRLALTIERANGRISHLARLRSQSPVYTHGLLLEGHTYRGQPLGSSALIGGGGLYVALDRVGVRRSRHAEIELLGGPQSGEGGGWMGKPQGESRVGAGGEWRWRERWIGWTGSLAVSHGHRPPVGIALAAKVR